MQLFMQTTPAKAGVDPSAQAPSQKPGDAEEASNFADVVDGTAGGAETGKLPPPAPSITLGADLVETPINEKELATKDGVELGKTLPNALPLVQEQGARPLANRPIGPAINLANDKGQLDQSDVLPVNPRRPEILALDAANDQAAKQPARLVPQAKSDVDPDLAKQVDQRITSKDSTGTPGAEEALRTPRSATLVEADPAPKPTQNQITPETGAQRPDAENDQLVKQARTVGANPIEPASIQQSVERGSSETSKPDMAPLANRSQTGQLAESAEKSGHEQRNLPIAASSAEATVAKAAQTNVQPVGTMAQQAGAMVQPVLTDTVVSLDQPVSDLDGPSALATKEGEEITQLRAGADRTRAEVVPRAVVTQVVHSITRSNVEGFVEIRLQPEELGRVRLTMLPGDLGVTVQVSAERPETLDLMRRNIDMLEADLMERGFTNLAFSFGEDAEPKEESGFAGGAQTKSDGSDDLGHLQVNLKDVALALPGGRVDLRV